MVRSQGFEDGVEIFGNGENAHFVGGDQAVDLLDFGRTVVQNIVILYNFDHFFVIGNISGRVQNKILHLKGAFLLFDGEFGVNGVEGNGKNRQNGGVSLSSDFFLDEIGFVSEEVIEVLEVEEGVHVVELGLQKNFGHVFVVHGNVSLLGVVSFVHSKFNQNFHVFHHFQAALVQVVFFANIENIKSYV